MPRNETGSCQPVWVTQAVTVTALGRSTDETLTQVMAGNSGISPIERFSTEKYITNVAACVRDLTANGKASVLHSFLDLALSQVSTLPPHTRLLTATTKGAIDCLERWRRGLPTDTQCLAIRKVLSFVSDRLGLRDPGENINAACASSTIALARGAAMIATGKAETVVVCCMDLVSEFVFSGFSALQALSPTACRPFDRDRAGLTLGEGIAAIVLTSAARARRDRQDPLGVIRGWGIANDANHITAPARDGCGLVQATRQALDRAEIAPDEVAAISAHGTGTVYNDLMELTAFRKVFGAEHRIPIHSLKGAIGHTLAAAGGIETALGLRALDAQTAPPTIGFETPEAGAEELVEAQPVTFTGDSLLTTNSGFGGINAALVLGRRPGA